MPTEPPLTPPEGRAIPSYPGPDEPDRGGHPKWVGPVALLAVIALLIGSVAVALVVFDDDSDSAAPSGQAEVPAETDEPPVAGDPAPDFDATMAELMAFVEAERGLEFKTPPLVEVLGDDEFSARLLEDFDEVEERAEEIRSLRASIHQTPS